MTLQNDTKLVYETPEIIYEGNISTRAGSPPAPGPDDNGIDLFGN